MATSRRIYWDACSWIALIQQETLLDDKGRTIEDRYSMCRSVVQVAEKGQIEIATSTLSLAEVNRNPAGTKSGEDKIAGYFERDYVLLVNLDTAVGGRARLLMQSRFSGLKPADACHLATAVIASVDEFHTFDGRLIALSGLITGLITKLDGTKLTICKPDPGGEPMPLLDTLSKQSPTEDQPAETVVASTVQPTEAQTNPAGVSAPPPASEEQKKSIVEPEKPKTDTAVNQTELMGTPHAENAPPASGAPEPPKGNDKAR
jgi:predicted nucleic acid-binding protein